MFESSSLWQGRRYSRDERVRRSDMAPRQFLGWVNVNSTLQEHDISAAPFSEIKALFGAGMIDARQPGPA